MRQAADRALVDGLVEASPDAVFAFLSDLRNHPRLATAVVAAVELDGTGASSGGWIRLRGPFGLTRRAHTRITHAFAPASGVGGIIEGVAETPAGTSARVTWRISGHPRGTRIALELVVDRATRLDRLLLALGGRRWLERRLLAAALDDLRSAVQP